MCYFTMEFNSEIAYVISERKSELNREESDQDQCDFARTIVAESPHIKCFIENIRSLIVNRKRAIEDVEKARLSLSLLYMKGKAFVKEKQYELALKAVSDGLCGIPHRMVEICKSLKTLEPQQSIDSGIVVSAARNNVDYSESADSDSDVEDGRVQMKLDSPRLSTEPVPGYVADLLSLRSVILFELGRYQLCLDDVQKSLLLGVRQENVHVLKLTLAKALARTGATEEAKHVLSKIACRAHNEEMIVKQIDILEAELASGVSSVLPGVSFLNGPNLPSVAAGENESLSHCSKLVKVKYAKEKGRYLVASDNIRAGSVLMVEKPYASVLLPEFYTSHCYNCLKSLVAPIGCLSCTDVRFCGEACRDLAWEGFHSVECSIWPLVQMLDSSSHLALRIMLSTPVDVLSDVHARHHNCAENERLGFSDGHYSGSYATVYHLVMNSEQHPPGQLLSYLLTACLLAQFIESRNGRFSAVGLCQDQRDTRCAGALRRLSRSCPELRPNPHAENRRSEAVRRVSLVEAFAEGSVKSLNDPFRSYCTFCQKLDCACYTEDVPNAFSKRSSVGFGSRTWSTPSLSAFADASSSSGLPQLTLMTILFRHLKQMTCNAFAITALVNQEHETIGEGAALHRSKSVLRKIGWAVYPAASLLNHSCDPDVFLKFMDDVLVVRATHNVNRGEEITHCYGPSSGKMIRTARQQILQQQYFFHCGCGACRRDEERDIGQLLALYLKCPQCHGLLSLAYTDGTFVGQCARCGYSSAMTDVIEQIQDTKERMVAAEEAFRRGEARASLSLLTDVLKRRSDILMPAGKMIYEVHDAMAKCFAKLGDWTLAAHHCTLSTEAIEKQFGNTSVELAHELHKLAQFLCRGNFAMRSVAVAERAIKLLSYHYGSQAPVVRELMKLLEYVLSVQVEPVN